MKSIADHRAFYASFVVKGADSNDQRLIAAFASVERESYLGKGPWPIFVRPGEYLMSPGRDPRLLYQDVLVGIIPERGINNGQPGLHALCLAACGISAGESVVHVGAGTGYYTAIIAALVGSLGSVTAYEIEPMLAEQAAANLRHLQNVRLVFESATQAALPAADVVYVSAGATHPFASWLDALHVGGRLVFPLTPNEGLGCMLMITRRGRPDAYAARVLTRAGFIPCVGARNAAHSAAVQFALATRSPMDVRSLRRGTTPDSTAWCAGDDWWLSTAEPSHD